MTNLTKRYFEALGWSKSLVASPPGTFVWEYDYKDNQGNAREGFPSIEHDYNEFFKWVRDEIEGRGWKMTITNHQLHDDGSFSVWFQAKQDHRAGSTTNLSMNRDFRIAGIKAAIKLLEAENESK